jgi:exopolyphosphatase/guanosine-5'-triphosphate,3'-diphosphate pyrophosphatase
MELCDDDPDHSLQVARLSLQLHDALGERLGLGDADRELLEAAALLSNVGLFVSHSGHHKHSYYVIRNSEHLMGFTDREIELIAQVARYHRKSQPSEDKHAEFAALDEAERARVRSMAGVLRVAIGLDRNHDGAVHEVEVRDEGEVVHLRPVPAEADTDLTLERYSADHRSALLAQQLGAEVLVEG